MILKIGFCLSVLEGGEGAWPVLHISVLVMNRLNTTESAIFIYLVYPLLPWDLTIQNLFPLQMVLCRMAAVKRLPVHHHSVNYIFLSFGIIEFI